MTMFSKAAQGVNLTPAQRATLKLVKTVGATVLAYLLSGQGLAVLNAIQQPGANVGAILHDSLLMPVIVVALLTLDKYSSAKGDKPLADALGAAAQAIEPKVAASPAIQEAADSAL